MYTTTILFFAGTGHLVHEKTFRNKEYSFAVCQAVREAGIHPDEDDVYGDPDYFLEVDDYEARENGTPIVWVYVTIVGPWREEMFKLKLKL